jgi:phospholipid transport system transporter-binding protein
LYGKMTAPFGIATTGPDRLLARGELSFATAGQALRDGLALLPSSGRCTIDLAGITSADSAGLAVLIEWLSVASERGTTLAFEAVPAQLRAIARISDLEELIAGQSGG